MNETTVTVVGHVAKEPILRVTGTGTRVVSFRLASTERRFDKALNGWRDGDTAWWSVSCWRNMGDNVLDSLAVGDPVIVHGRLRMREYEKEGVKQSSFEIEASSVGHDMARGVSRFTRATVGAGSRDLAVADDSHDDSRDDSRDHSRDDSRDDSATDSAADAAPGYRVPSPSAA